MSTKIKTIRVSNLRNISEQELNLNGCTAIIIGGNNKGKSTLAKALIERFRGIKNENIVRQDCSDGWYCMELTNGEKIVWHINDKGKEKLTITADGKTEKVTKEIMQYYFPSTFDVDKFLNETPSAQRKILEKLSGLDFTEVDQEYKIAYENRAYYNRILKEAEAKQIQFETHWKYCMQDTKPIEDEINGIGLHNSNYYTVKAKLQEKELQLKQKYEMIESLKRQVARLEEESMQLETEIDKGKNWLSDEKRLPKDEEYTKLIVRKLEDVKNNNKAYELSLAFENAQLNALNSESDIKKILQDKEEMIRLANMPEGFGFNEEGITYNKLPYNKKNQSSSALYTGALKLAACSIGEVKAIHFDASYLDKNSLQQIQEWAENNKLQLLIERPDFNGGEISYEIIED